MVARWGLNCSIQGGADCSQLLYSTVMKNAVCLSWTSLLLWTQTFSAHPPWQVVLRLSTFCVCVLLYVTCLLAGCRTEIHHVGRLPC